MRYTYRFCEKCSGTGMVQIGEISPITMIRGRVTCPECDGAGWTKWEEGVIYSLTTT